MEPTTKGDVNGDKSVNAKDVVTITDIIANGGYDDAADLNGDNVVNIADIIVLVNMIESSANSEWLFSSKWLYLIDFFIENQQCA